VPNVQSRTPDDGQRNCPKHVGLLDKNKFGKISASVGFIKKKLVTMHGHMNVKNAKRGFSYLIFQLKMCTDVSPVLINTICREAATEEKERNNQSLWRIKPGPKTHTVTFVPKAL
jgi:hypothetical protein